MQNTMSTTWHKLTLDPKKLVSPREELHQAIQSVAMVGRHFLPKSEEDEYANLEWDEEFFGLVGQEIGEHLQTGLRFSDFTYWILREGKPRTTLFMEGKTHKELHDWIKGRLKDFGLDGQGMWLNLPYELPPYPKGMNVFSYEEIKYFSELGKYFSNANAILREIAATSSDFSPVKCWPHHFDIATLKTLDEKRSINLGFSPGDEHYLEPYFYVTPWPFLGPENLKLLPLKAGHWHHGTFVAAILTASDLLKSEDQADLVKGFLEEGLTFCKELKP